MYDLKVTRYAGDVYVLLDPFCDHFSVSSGIAPSRTARMFPTAFVPVGSTDSICVLRYAIIIHRGL